MILALVLPLLLGASAAHGQTIIIPSYTATVVNVTNYGNNEDRRWLVDFSSFSTKPIVEVLFTSFATEVGTPFPYNY